MSDFKELWPGGPLYSGESFGTDALALAAFAGARDFARACDLGCGSGILLLLLAWEKPRAALHGLELRSAAAEQCRENIAANGWEDRCAVTAGNASDALLPGAGFDLVVTNPPYFPDRHSADRERALRRTESMPIENWCAEAARLLKPGGDCCAVYPAARLTDLLCGLRGAGLEPKELRFLAHRPARPRHVFSAGPGRAASRGSRWPLPCFKPMKPAGRPANTEKSAIGRHKLWPAFCIWWARPSAI